MPTDRINGYNITGNHGTGEDRQYRICNAGGDVLHTSPGSKTIAIATAKSLPPGDVPEPEPEPEPPPQPTEKVAQRRKTK